MASSLAFQLAQVAAKSKSTLNIKIQKANHSKSLIWEPQVAATQSYQTVYAACYQGFEELCQLDDRFTRFSATLFSEESQNQDRMQLTAAENEELDKQIDAFLRLVGSRLRLMPAVKAIEWLIRRFRIHDENTSDLLMTFLPYHSIPAFATLLSVLPAKVTPQFRFLDPYIRSLTPPPRSVFVHQAVHHPEFLTAFSEYTLKSCRMHCQYTALISFWGGIMTESISGILERGKSGRAAIQDENNQAFLHTFGSIFSESLSMRKVPSLQIASYMAVSVIVSVGNFEDVAITAFMEQIVHAWTTDTLKPGLICLAIMAQQRSAKQLSAKITKSLTKVPDIGSLLIEIGQERRVDKLANGLCLALVERLSKKSDSRGLPTVLDILSSQILKERQVAVIFKSLLLAALQIEETSDEDGSLRRKLGSTLMDLSQVSGKAGDTIQSVIQDMKFDIEELEIKLDLSFRARQMPETAGNVWKTDASPARPTPDLDAMIDNLSSQVGELSPCLIPQSNALFDELSHLFLTIVSDRDGEKALLAKFTAIPKLGSIAAFKDGTYFSFFIQLMCGPYPALARAAAIDMVKDRLKADVAEKPDAQSLLPYCIVALGDPSQRVRRAASDLVAVLDSIFLPSGPPRSKATEALGSLYRDSKAAVLPPEVCARVLHLQILPAVEECILDPNHICEVLRLAMETGKYQIPPEPQVDKKDHLSQSGRLALMTFLSSHVILTPLTIAKERLLKTLNEVRGVQNTTRTQLLLPALQWWVGLNASQVSDLCTLAQIETVTLDARFVDVIVPNDKAGVNYLLEVVSLPETDARSTLVQAIFARLKRMWPSMSDDMKSVVAEHLLRVSQQQTDGASPALASQEGADFLRTVPLTTGILAFFLDSILTGTKMITEPPPNKRRRVSSTDGNRGLVTQVAPELSHALRRVTFVLQLLENSEPSSHPELLNGLFTTLSELQHFRTVVGSELGYLQNLVLRSLLAMMPTYKANKNLSIDNSGGYGDLLVNCIQKSSSPVVQNAALLLIASLATTAPDLVLHSVMPIFTFMGTSVLRQSDDYSAHVVSQTIKEVIPPLIESLRHGRKNPVTGASEILVSFTTAYEHIPAYRRQPLFVALVETLGAREFLFALVGMLVDRYGTSDALLRFILDLLNHFSIEVQLTTLVKLLELVADLYQTKPGISRTLLGIGDEDDQKNVDQIALRQLSALPTFISSRKLKARFGELVDRNDMHASEARELYAAMLEHILGLAHTVKHNKALHSRCGVSLSNLLDLLSIAEFIRSVENLLDNSDMGLRQKVLRALEVRVESESQSDAVSRNALLAFLPQLTSTIRESNDMRYKHTAVTCVDKIAEKYGKKDIEAVVAAASVIAGEHCLGQNEKQLRVMGLLCLTSLVDVLEDAIIPVLPTALPQAVAYLQDSLRSGHVDEQLHNACYSFMTSLAEHLPYMLSPYVDRILEVSNASAVAGLDGETNEGRASCLQFLADRMDGRTMFASLSRNWDSALSAGLLAVSQHVDLLGLLIDKHSKSTMNKNAALVSEVLTKALDLRRETQSRGGAISANPGLVSEIEGKVCGKYLGMIYKLNDASFRPIFVQLIEWSSQGPSNGDQKGKMLRQQSVYSFLQTFFDNLKSIVTSYATYVLDDAVKILRTADLTDPTGRDLWKHVLGTLAKCFEHDQDDFWQSPAHFSAIAPTLTEQFLRAPSTDVSQDVIPAVVELAAAADSQTHQKELNSALLKHLKSEETAVRLATVRCEQELTDRLGEEWLSMLHEMLPRISELQEDDDEEVERETHRWIVKIEAVLGESLDAMLQ